MKKILLDTDVIIDFLKDHPKALLFMEQEALFCISVISIIELYTGVRNKKEKDFLNGLCSYIY